MLKIFIETLIDTLKMMPFLLLIYIVIEIVEYKFSDKIREGVERAGKTGPFFGALAGSFPQCGFSIITTALYNQRLVTIGTLIAVYLSTSDEAIPVMIASPGSAKLIIPLIIIKIIIAIIAGYSIDLFFKQKNKETLTHIDAYAHGTDDKSHHHQSVLNEVACCDHSVSSHAQTFKIKELFLHPLKHTVKIFIFIFLTSFIVGLAFASFGEVRIADAFANFSLLQPFVAGLIGLIPNCAASVALTELYLKGVITYGSLIAGLCAGGGIGILVLFREEKNKIEVFKIIGLLFGISVLVGLIIQSLS
jgi:hypothetical protein